MPFNVGDVVQAVGATGHYNGMEGTIVSFDRNIATVRTEHAGYLSFYVGDLALSRNASARTIGEFFKKQEQMTCPST